MKKLLSMVAVGAVAGVAMGVDVLETTVGVTAVSCSTTNAIIAVSYGDLATSGNISISNLVKTTNLKAGDTLQVYNEATGKFIVFTLEGKDNSPKFWKATEAFTLNAKETEKADPAATTRAPGYGIWLIRGSGWASSGYPTFTFYLYGNPNVTRPETSGTAISIPADAARLVGNPKGTAAVPTVTNVAANDRIIVPASTLTGTRIYTWNATTSKWTTKVKGQREELSVPPGSGFWYAPSGTGSARQLYW